MKALKVHNPRRYRHTLHTLHTLLYNCLVCSACVKIQRYTISIHDKIKCASLGVVWGSIQKFDKDSDLSGSSLLPTLRGIPGSA